MAKMLMFKQEQKQNSCQPSFTLIGHFPLPLDGYIKSSAENILPPDS